MAKANISMLKGLVAVNNLAKKIKVFCKHSKAVWQVVVQADWVRKHYRGKVGICKFPHTHNGVSPNLFVSSAFILTYGERNLLGNNGEYIW